MSEIKIDQSFVQGIADNNDHRLIVQAIISMAKSLGKELVAEGDGWTGRVFKRLQLQCRAGLSV